MRPAPLVTTGFIDLSPLSITCPDCVVPVYDMRTGGLTPNESTRRGGVLSGMGQDFVRRLARMVRPSPKPIAEGQWWVYVGGKRAPLPLGGLDTWLEWD
jgi:hypothetical protein